MESQLSEDVALKALKAQIEELERELEEEMATHNSVAVKKVQRQLDKLQGEYNDKVFQLIMGLPVVEPPSSLPVLTTSTPSPPRIPGKRKRKRVESPTTSNSATKLFRPAPPSEPVVIPRPDEEAQTNGEDHFLPVTPGDGAQTEEVIHIESIPEFVQDVRKDGGYQETAAPAGLETSETPAASSAEAANEERLTVEDEPEREDKMEELAVGTSQPDTLEPLRLEITKLRATIERLSEALGASEGDRAASQMHLREAEAKHQGLVAELENEKNRTAEIMETLEKMTDSKDEAISALTADKALVEAKWAEVLAELKAEKESVQLTRQESAERKEQLAKYEDEIGALQRQLSLVQEANSELVASQKRYEEQLKDAKATQQDDEKSMDEPAKEQALQLEIEQATRKIEEQTQELARVKEEARSNEIQFQERLAALKDKEAELLAIIQNHTNEGELLRQTIQSLSEQKEAVEGELHSVKQQNDESHRARRLLEEQVQSLVAENESIKANQEEIRGEGEKISKERLHLREQLQALKEKEQRWANWEKEKNEEIEKLNAESQRAAEKTKEVLNALQERENTVHKLEEHIAAVIKLAEERDNKIEELTSKLKEQKALIKERKEEAGRSKEELEGLEKEKAALENSLQEVRKANKNLMQKLQNNKAEYGKVAEETQSLTKQNEKRKRTIEKLQAELDRMKEEVGKVATLEKEKSELEQEVNELKKQTSTLQETNSGLEESMKGLKKGQKEAISTLEKERDALREQLKAEEEKILENQNKEARLAEEFENAKKEAAEVQKNLKNKLAKERNDAEALRGELEKMLQNKEIIEELRETIKQKDGRITALESQIAELQKTEEVPQRGSQKRKRSQSTPPEEKEKATPPSQKGRGSKRDREEEQEEKEQRSASPVATKKRRRVKESEEEENGKEEQEEEKHQTQDPIIKEDKKRKVEAASPARAPVSPKKLKSPSGLRVGSKSERGARPVMVYFSGFKDEPNSKYTTSFKTELASMVEKLGGHVRLESEFDAKITHVVTPPNCRTMKTLAAALTNRWLVSPDWVVESDKEGRFVEEALHGVRYTERPFEGKVFYLSKNFKQESSKGQDLKVKNAHTLATSLGKGTIVKEGGPNVDFTLVTKEVDSSDIFGKPLTWNDFVNMIPGTGKTSEKATTTTSTTSPAGQVKKGVRFSTPKKDEAEAKPEPKAGSEKRSPATRTRK